MDNPRRSHSGNWKSSRNSPNSRLWWIGWGWQIKSL